MLDLLGENLLPEGALRVYLSGLRKASTLFAMLLEVAGDTAGGFVLLSAAWPKCASLR
ncbi:MAG: hypothetical protein Q8K34_17815 [Hydrogenophaga sp.]|nr:hypothetical protein [Hydrogenophaga sp.]